ncbi:ADP-forming succinate--CoA ligase subunit beta [Solemya velesiana gill symbiont]|uniref:Succinate--CoA ligase [ADP-forming] subunit beta n=1 Tax=Solemya velesiana gill symbiont TaxID=1918948 RepID=A0A1T2KW25_9GAMM|nr:ADP-forming succinate--CoA ligase subunit beta [Solemya velesiana gill symbiont]OOZ36940.1 succinate--CoA ligase subunit beta [Solemya velesiana gill symbiont]
MNLHEYQSKQLFAKQGIPVPEGKPAQTVDKAREAAQVIDGERWVVKAQVHAGGRGKAGGVVLVDSLDAVEAEAERLIGSRLVTKQTGEPGLPIDTLLIEAPTDIDRELYLSALVDRAERKILFMASSAGGMNIEEVAEETPEKIETIHVDPAAGLQGYQCRKLAFALELEGQQIREFNKFMRGLYNLFVESDASLVEINPLVVTKAGNLIALDAKINLDDNAFYRQSELVALRDVAQEDEREAKAKEHDLNYITLDGNIGCMVNGAGLAMATMDLVQLKGGAPANFLDVGGGTTAERVAEAFKLILSDEKVEAVLVNIFGGIVRCDLIADGIIQAVKEVDVKVPVVVRLEGTNAPAGLEKLAASGLAIETAADLSEGAEKVVSAAKR